MSKRKGRKKGTVWYFSDVIVAVTSMITVVFMLFVSVLIIFVMNAQLDVNVIGGLLYGVPKADSDLLAYLDSSSGEHKMKELVSYAVWEEKETFTLDGQEIDLKTISKEKMDKITDKAYALRLELGGESVTLAKTGTPEAVDYVKAETIIYGGETNGKLTLVIAQ